MKKCMRFVVAMLAIVFFLVTVVFLFADSHKTAPESLGTVRVNIETYLAGQNQLTHPSVLVFPKTWNGFRYWMGYSPYPYSSGEEENPCLAVSNDLLCWECPFGLANPIADNEETGCNELKDPHLVYRDDLDRLEMWYLGRLSENLGGDGSSLLLFRKYSQDGIHWSDYEVMTSTKYLSPSIIWDGTKYQMWSIGYDLWDTSGTFVYQESVNGFDWSIPISCSLDDQYSNIDIWHGSVTMYDGEYQFVFVDNTDKQEIFHCSSMDGIHFRDLNVIIKNNEYWDYLYRPVLVYDENTVSCIYGVVNQENQWYISMSIGSELNHLEGVKQAKKEDMFPLTDDVVDTHGIYYSVKKVYDVIQLYFRLELLMLVVVETMVLSLFKKLRDMKYIITVFTSINILISFVYIFILFHPIAFEHWLGAFWTIYYLNLGIWVVLKYLLISMSKEINSEK